MAKGQKGLVSKIPHTPGIDMSGLVYRSRSKQFRSNDKVFVIGKYIKETFKGLKTDKKAKILTKKSDIIELINKDLDNNDYLMIKGSNATGLNKITQNLKRRNANVI